MSGREGGPHVARHIAEHVEATGGLFGKHTLVSPACPTEAYVCATCGYVEEYVKDVADIDWSDVHGATLLE